MRQHGENEFSCLNFTVIALCSSHSFQETKYPPGEVCAGVCGAGRGRVCVPVFVHDHAPACVFVHV